MKLIVSVEGQERKGDQKANSENNVAPNPAIEQERKGKTGSDLSFEKLEKDLEEEKRKSAELSKRMLYLQSDYANQQRQIEKRIAESIEDTRLQYIVELISVKEDLERAMSVAKTVKQDTLVDGLRMLLSRVDGILRADEVERIVVSAGNEFDTRIHEAVAYSDGNDKKEGTILSVVSNGYTLRGKVIKPALVEVSRENKSPSEVEGSKSEEPRDTELNMGQVTSEETSVE